MAIPDLRTGMAGGVVALLAGSVVAQVTALAVTPLLSRIYAPAQLAALTQLMAIAGVLAPLATLKLEIALMLPRRTSVAGRLFGLAVVSSVAVAIAAMLGLLILPADWFTGLVSALPPDLRLSVPVAAFAMALFIVMGGVATREGHFRRLGTARAVAAVVTALVAVVTGWLTGRTAGLVWALPLGQLAGVVVLVPAQGVLTAGARCFDRLGRAALHRFRRYPLLNGSSSFLNGLTIGLPAITLGWYCTDEVVGQYGMAFRLAAAPITLAAMSIGQVNLRTVSRMVREGHDAHPHVRRTLLRLWFVAGIGLLVSMLLGPSLFAWILGPEWRTAGEFLVLLAPGLAARFVGTPMSTTLGATEHVEWVFIWRVVACVAVLSALLVVGPGGDPRVILATLSAVDVILYAALQVLVVRAARSPRSRGRRVRLEPGHVRHHPNHRARS